MAARTDWQRHIHGLGGDGQPLAVYAILSSSDLLVQDAVAKLRSCVLTQAADFNRDALQGGQTTPAAIVAAASCLPVMAARRWVHVSQVHKLNVKNAEPLLAYLANPAPGTVLCFSGEKVDQRTKLGQSLGKSGALFNLDPPRPSELPQWIMQRAQQLQARIEPDAAALMVDLVGADLGMLLANLDKVLLYAGANTAVTATHVGEAVAATRIGSVFELTDAVGLRTWAAASQRLRNLLGGGESSLLILAMLARQLRQLLQVKALSQHNPGTPALAQAMGVRPFVVETLRQQARKYSTAELQHALQLCGVADMKLKSSRVDHGLLLDGLLLDIMGAA